MSEIIEDTISRNKKFKKERLSILERMKQLGVPASLIEREELIVNMTIAEYESFLKEEKRLFQEEINKYAKNNSLKKEIVDEIYKRMEGLKYDYFTYSSRVRFVSEIDPLKFMSESDYDYELYDTFINHALELYQKKYEKEWNLDNIES
jgi:hypothetical protein